MVVQAASTEQAPRDILRSLSFGSGTPPAVGDVLRSCGGCGKLADGSEIKPPPDQSAGSCLIATFSSGVNSRIRREGTSEDLQMFTTEENDLLCRVEGDAPM